MTGIDRARLDVETVRRAPDRMHELRDGLVAELGYVPKLFRISADTSRSLMPPSVERAHEEITRIHAEAQRAAKRADAAIYIEETATAGDRVRAHELRRELNAARAALDVAVANTIEFRE